MKVSQVELINIMILFSTIWNIAQHLKDLLFLGILLVYRNMPVEAILLPTVGTGPEQF